MTADGVNMCVEQAAHAYSVSGDVCAMLSIICGIGI
jgi:hypothetical protein